MGAAPAPEFVADVTVFLIDIVVLIQTAFQRSFSCGVFKTQVADPVSKCMTPVGVVIFYRQFYAKVEQLAFDVTFDSSKILYRIQASTKQTAQMLPLYIRYCDPFQPAITQFFADQLRIQQIRLLVAQLTGTAGLNTTLFQP